MTEHTMIQIVDRIAPMFYLLGLGGTFAGLALFLAVFRRGNPKRIRALESRVSHLEERASRASSNGEERRLLLEERVSNLETIVVNRAIEE